MPPTIEPLPGAPSSAARSSFNEDSEICNFASYAFGSVEISMLVCSAYLGVGFGLAISALTTVAEKTKQNANRRAFIKGSPFRSYRSLLLKNQPNKSGFHED